MVIKDYLKLLETENDTSLKSMMSQIRFTSDITDSELFELSIEELVELFNSIRFEFDNAKDYIEVDGHQLNIVDYKTISFGEFIDLEYYISEDWQVNISYIVSILYRSVEFRKMKVDKYEPYNEIDLNYRSIKINNSVNINDVYENILDYFKFRDSLFDSYTFFDDGLDDIDPDELTSEEKTIYDEEIIKMDNSKKTMWEDMLALLSDGDLTKYDEILGMNVILVFNRLSKIISDNRNRNKSGTKSE